MSENVAIGKLFLVQHRVEESQIIYVLFSLVFPAIFPPYTHVHSCVSQQWVEVYWHRALLSPSLRCTIRHPVFPLESPCFPFQKYHFSASIHGCQQRCGFCCCFSVKEPMTRCWVHYASSLCFLKATVTWNSYPGGAREPIKTGIMPAVTEECMYLLFLHFLLLNVRVALR